jgi:hypothetical protein
MSEASTELNDAFNPSAEEGTPEFTLLPKGAYVASIVDAVVKPFKSGKGQAVFLTWEISGEKYAGRRVWDSCALSHESEMAMKIGRQRFKDICDACGLTEAFKDLTLLYNKLHTIFVVIEESADGRYPPKNRVSSVKGISAKSGNGAAEKKAPFDDSIPF